MEVLRKLIRNHHFLAFKFLPGFDFRGKNPIRRKGFALTASSLLHDQEVDKSYRYLLAPT